MAYGGHVAISHGMNGVFAMTSLDPISYVKSLQLPPSDSSLIDHGPLKIEDDKEAGYVDAGQLVAFAAGVSTGSKADVLNSMLLAQLAANVVADRETATIAWYKKYREVLENIGWAVSEFQFTQTHLSGSTFQIKDTVLKLIAALASENALLITTATIAAVESLGEGDDRVALFSSQSSNPSSGNFQVGAVVEDRSTPTMSIAASYFSSSDVKTNFLWFSFQSSSTDLYQASQTITLSEAVYSKVRQSIIDKLGARAQTYVADLDIGA